MSSKITINLLQAELLPKKQLLTLERVLISWGAMLVIMLAVVFIINYQLQQQTVAQITLKKRAVEQELLQSQLQEQVGKNKAGAAFIDKLALLKLLIANKQALHYKLTNNDSTYVIGFAKAMSDLSAMHSRDISLQRMHISHDEMMFSGMAKSPEAVPAWLAQFESSPVLAGKVFSYFKLSENESSFTDFVVSTSPVLDAKPLLAGEE